MHALPRLVGANIDLGEPGASLNTIGLLTFGYYDYDTLMNTGLGFGNTPWIPTIFFWLLVFITLMFAQNIILAIVADAYSDSAAKVPEDHMTFVRMTIRRLIYEALCIFPTWRDGKLVLGHKSTWVKELKVDAIRVSDAEPRGQHGDQIHAIAEMISRRDDSMMYRKGKVKKVLDDQSKFLIAYDEGDTGNSNDDETGNSWHYEETVRIGSIKAVTEEFDENEGTLKEKICRIPKQGDSVFVRYP